jgi:hypothetical protein
LKEKSEGGGFLAFYVSGWMNDLNVAHVAQLVEHILGKDEVISSILIMGSSLTQRTKPNAGETNG